MRRSRWVKLYTRNRFTISRRGYDKVTIMNPIINTRIDQYTNSANQKQLLLVFRIGSDHSRSFLIKETLNGRKYVFDIRYMVGL